jgi:hypothetical protein
MNMAVPSRLDEIQQFLQFAMAQWPQLRGQVAAQLARRCERCIVSERYLPIQDGLCTACRAAGDASAIPYGERRALARRVDASGMEQQLGQVLQQHAGRGAGNFDALLLFSGGKDSAFLLHRLRTEFPMLRLLAVTVDNGFFSQVALANCRRILERVEGVDHMFFKPHRQLYIKTFRHALTHLNEGGCYTTVDRMDGDLTFDIARNLAAGLEIPLMIAGLSPGQVERILGLQSFETRRQDEQKKRTECAGFALEEIYDDRERTTYWWDGTAWDERRIPRVLYPFYAWGYDEDWIRAEVVRLGLLEAGQDNPLATNNDTIPVMLAVDSCRLGYSGFEPEFAELVRAGKADRAFWLAVFESLEYLSQRGQFMPHSVAETLQRLGLSHADVGLPVPAG